MEKIIIENKNQDFSVMVADATDAALIEAIKRLEKHHIETQKFLIEYARTILLNELQERGFSLHYCKFSDAAKNCQFVFHLPHVVVLKMEKI